VIRVLTIIALLAAVLATACDDDDSAGDGPNGTPQPTSTPDGGGVAPAITINQPSPRSTVSVPFTISGSANVFEGSLQVRVEDANGDALCERTVQATSGTGTPGNWTTIMAFMPPQYRGATATTLVPAPVEGTIRAFSFSAEDGSEQNIVLQQIVIDATLPNIVIEDPLCNSEASKEQPLEVNGQALVFEAALTVELRDQSGATVLSNRVMAANGTEMSPWSTTFDLNSPSIAPGRYEIVALSFSAKDGSPENEFAIPIEVTP
jgi:hypothetical protein